MLPQDDRTTGSVGCSAKRRRTDRRVVLDVGGTRFVCSASTLISNSTYFASLLSHNWRSVGDADESNGRRHGEDNEDDEEAFFLDHDPVPFGILLAYMRRGMIKVEDVDADVLALAEFLGGERLIRAVKVRWYINIGRGPVFREDDKIVAAFDQEHGGIRRAISSGLLPYFHRRDNVNAEKDLAIVTIFSPDENIETNTITVREATLQGEQRPGSGSPECAARCLVGALNGLHSKGYTMHESQLDRSNRYEDIMTFSRRRHDTMDGTANDATEIFIPSECEINDRLLERHSDGYIKQFAMLLEETEVWNEITLAPAEFVHEIRPMIRGDDHDDEDPYTVVRLDGRGPWLENNGFVTREDDYEKLFECYIKSLLAFHFPQSRREVFRMCRIYSRKIRRPQQRKK
mmetsp:Transcript_37669/g.90809  ORF Transcript_37669/g.90809 Transcript_37669/m.90809 type:complete len:403 (-) Transcript_37669:96-1304(-)